MTAVSSQETVTVRRRWNESDVAHISAEAFWDFHFRNDAGGVCRALPRAFLYAKGRRPMICSSASCLTITWRRFTSACVRRLGAESSRSTVGVTFACAHVIAEKFEHLGPKC